MIDWGREDSTFKALNIIIALLVTHQYKQATLTNYRASEVGSASGLTSESLV